MLAPNEYSLVFCFISFGMYMAFSINYLIMTGDKNYFTFDTFFLIAMLFTNFIYPVFYYPTPFRYFSLFNVPFNEDVITKATALSLCGMMAYFCGATSVRKRLRKNRVEKIKINFSRLKLKHQNRFVIRICYFLFILFLSMVGTSFLTGQYQGTSNWEGLSLQLYILFMTFLTISIIIEVLIFKDSNYKGFFSFLADFNKSILLLIASFCGLFLIIGDRGGPIAIILVFLSAYSFLIRPIKLQAFFVIILIGFISMTIIGKGRVAETTDLSYMERVSENLEINSGLDYASGLIINNRSLFVLYDYAYSNENFFGLNYFSSAISIVPSLERLLKQISDYDATFTSTSNFVTYLAFGDNPPYGLGTNLIGGIYLSFGFFGVIIIMYFLGRFVGNVARKSKYSFIHLLIFLVLVSYSLSLSRADILLPLRMIVWSLVIYWVFYSSSFKKAIYENQ